MDTTHMFMPHNYIVFQLDPLNDFSVASQSSAASLEDDQQTRTLEKWVRDGEMGYWGTYSPQRGLKKLGEQLLIQVTAFMGCVCFFLILEEKCCSFLYCVFMLLCMHE